MSGKVSLSITKKSDRSCADCTKCCEGWLNASINGYDIFPGRPCKIVRIGEGCTDYENRPESPCRTFSCFWKASDIMPEDLSPIKTNNIVYVDKIEDEYFLVVAPAGGDLDKEVLAWLEEAHLSKSKNIFWHDGKTNYYKGSSRFIELMTSKYGS